MERPFPVLLESDPIVESIFELRFSTEDGVPASDILPGILYPKLKTDFPKLVHLDTHRIPREVRSQDVNLKFAPLIRLDGEQFSIAIGDNVFSVSCRLPYVGWDKFKEEILAIVSMLNESGVINNIERFSLKYINMLQKYKGASGISMLDADVRLGPFNLSENGCSLRTEINKDGVINIVQIVSHAKAEFPGVERKMEGLLLDIDSVKQFAPPVGMQDFWENEFLDNLDKVREHEKNIFFSIVSKETVDSYSPVYEEQ